jgi:shikimate 5-dehydrogenase
MTTTGTIALMRPPNDRTVAPADDIDDLLGGVVRRDLPTMYFIGVSTGGSSILRLFPVWAGILGLRPAQLVGVDAAIHADPKVYRRAVAQIRFDPLSLGALVTTHKLDLLAATRDLFDELDPNAELCNEVSNLAKHDGRLIGYAKDPVTAGRALGEMLEPGHWGRTGGHVLCFGAGGATTAITAHLLSRPDPGDRPARLVVVARNSESLDRLGSVVARLRAEVEIDYVLNTEAARNDDLVGRLPPGSVVVNATGMGKDRPGSPITDGATFPEYGIAWELNYRGDLLFLGQARAQTAGRDLHVFDGWRYFIHNWVEHIREVFDLDIEGGLFERLAEAAEPFRN